MGLAVVSHLDDAKHLVVKAYDYYRGARKAKICVTVLANMSAKHWRPASLLVKRAKVPTALLHRVYIADHVISPCRPSASSLPFSTLRPLAQGILWFQIRSRQLFSVCNL
jgi:hypothetical protein